MLYCILAYHEEGAITSMTQPEDDALMDDLMRVHDRINTTNRLGPAARLDFTETAVTLRGPGEGEIIDGPFAETKEALLGVYLVECETRDAAIAAARDLKRVNKSAVYEIRPVALYLPGMPVASD